MMENWKDVPGYEGLYQVSDCGQVKSLERVVSGKGRSPQNLKERILKPTLNKGGYHQVYLCKNGKVKAYSVHRLVALAFLEGDNSLTVNHIDECKTNNHVSNLEYLTQGDNVRAWNKNNPGHRSKWIKKAHEARSQQVLDTQTNKMFSSIAEVSRYMYEEEDATGPFVWKSKIRRGTQDRFQIIK